MKIWIDRYFAYNMGRDDAQQQCLVCTEFICVSGYAKGAYNSVCVCVCFGYLNGHYNLYNIFKKDCKNIFVKVLVVLCFFKEHNK